MRKDALKVLAKNLLVASDRSRKEVLAYLSKEDRAYVTKLMEELRNS